MYKPQSKYRIQDARASPPALDVRHLPMVVKREAAMCISQKDLRSQGGTSRCGFRLMSVRKNCNLACELARPARLGLILDEQD